MHYTSQYPSPLGELLLAADDAGLTGVWFGRTKILCPLPGTGLGGAGDSAVCTGEAVACPLLRGTGAGTGNPHPHGGNRVSEGGVAHPPHHSVWADHDLWRHCPAGGGGAGYPADVPQAVGAQWDTIQFPSLSHATGWWGPTAA